MKKKSNKGLIIFTSFMVMILVIYLISALYTHDKKDELHNLWTVNIEGEELFLIHSSSAYKSFKSIKNEECLSTFDLENGSLKAEVKFDRSSFYSVRILAIVEHHLLIDREEGFFIYSLPTLEEELNHEKLKAELISEIEGLSNIHSIEWDELLREFSIKDDQANIFKMSFQDLMGADSSLSLKESNSFGFATIYPTSKAFFQEEAGITVENIDDVQSDVQFNDWMTLEDKLQLSKGYDKNYAVITRDSVCLFLDGNERRELKRLKHSTDSLMYESLSDQIWLKGLLLRPVKEIGKLPKNRSVTSVHEMVFVYAHNSLDESQDYTQLTAINYSSGLIQWQVEINKESISTDYFPIRSEVIDDQLVILWLNSMNHFALQSLDWKNGEQNWLIQY